MIENIRVKSINISEVQRQWQNEFGTWPPTRLTITRIRGKFEMDGTFGDVHKERSGISRTATIVATSEAVLQFTLRHFVRYENCGSSLGMIKGGLYGLI